MSYRVNRQGLGRYIPSDIRREVRQRSKFGCVICRSGFYEYEHIVPFEEVGTHDPRNICCLCEACHSRVTRGQWSKDWVRDRYSQVQGMTIEDAGEPKGPLDFHTGTVQLALGDLHYLPAVKSVLRYFGDDLISLNPGQCGQPGSISAVFTDDEGNAILELNENEWIGSLEVWDITVEGKRITVRKSGGRIALQLRLDPPGRIVIERLDMRVGAHHILVSEESYAVGVHGEEGEIYWFSPNILITKATPDGVAIEIASKQNLIERYDYFKLAGLGVGMASSNREVIQHSPAGVMIPAAEISVASFCSFHSYGFVAGFQSLDGMRKAVFSLSASEMRAYIVRG